MGADKSAENTPNAPKFICLNCLPKPKSLEFRWKKASLDVRSPCLCPLNQSDPISSVKIEELSRLKIRLKSILCDSWRFFVFLKVLARVFFTLSFTKLLIASHLKVSSLKQKSQNKSKLKSSCRITMQDKIAEPVVIGWKLRNIWSATFRIWFPYVNFTLAYPFILHLNF